VSDAKVQRARADKVAQAIAAAEAAPSPKHNVLQVQLENGRMVMVSVPMDLNEVEALQILGALPGWFMAARVDWLRRSAGGRLVLPS
jgi:hypothetical protein